MLAELHTKRLLLRQWNKADYPIFAQLNSDPEVMQYYPNVLSEDESNALAHKIESLITAKGWGFWAVETCHDHKFIGFVGLHEPTYQLPVSPCIEIGWRLAKAYWGHGYASEAACAALTFAFDVLKLPEVYSFASTSNLKSRAVMERLGLFNTHNNFNHPVIPAGNPLQEHALYKIDKNTWDNL